MRLIVIEEWKKLIKENNNNYIKSTHKQFKLSVFIKSKSSKN